MRHVVGSLYNCLWPHLELSVVSPCRRRSGRSIQLLCWIPDPRSFLDASGDLFGQRCAAMQWNVFCAFSSWQAPKPQHWRPLVYLVQSCNITARDRDSDSFCTAGVQGVATLAKWSGLNFFCRPEVYKSRQSCSAHGARRTFSAWLTSFIVLGLMVALWSLATAAFWNVPGWPPLV